MMIKLSKNQLRQLCRLLVPEYVGFLQDLQKDGGRYQIEKRLAAYLEKIGIYVRLYENEQQLNGVFAIGLFGVEWVKAFNQEIQQLNEEDAQAFADEFLTEVLEEDFSDFEWPTNEEALAKAKESFESMSPEEQKASTVQAARLIGGLMASFFNTLSLMVHGAKLTSLVPSAIAGDDDAFLKAVQIDRHILRHLPYFIERKKRAQDLGEAEFMRRLTYSESKPPLKGKIRYPALYMLFGFLEAAQSLNDFTHSELLDLCDEMDLDRFQNRIEDVNYLTKRLQEYRRWQKTGGLSMH